MSFHGLNLGFFGNLYVRHLAFERAGDAMDGHSHQFDHVTLLSHGAVTVSATDPTTKARVSRQYSAPAFIQTPATIMHEFVATEDDTQCWCLFAVRDLDGHVLDAAEMTGRPVMGF